MAGEESRLVGGGGGRLIYMDPAWHPESRMFLTGLLLKGRCAPRVLWIGWLVGNYGMVPGFPWRRDMQGLIHGVWCEAPEPAFLRSGLGSCCPRSGRVCRGEPVEEQETQGGGRPLELWSGQSGETPAAEGLVRAGGEPSCCQDIGTPSQG